MKIFDDGRPKYGKELEAVLDIISARQVLHLSYSVESQGKVRVDVATDHHGIFSFSYEYGNLEFSQDRWSDTPSSTIKEELLKDAIRFDSLKEYYVWRSIQLLTE